ncbi:peptidylprolyl isomerase protein [Entomophthora muscae]|uniref:Peptidylprolyl isomerase protein n=1 Tax=Entomophthora muscae TaxID=34485 RepID=A0ACC2TXM0_9FUNG|nr:peptidylprolyl isomerase protein [Entomophthora muscae]
MELADVPFMAPNLLMKTSYINIQKGYDACPFYLNTQGLLSMANSGINSNGSQFFILFDKANWLDGKHVVFGELEEGDDTLTKIEQQGTRGGMTKMKIKVVDCGEAL